MREICEKTKEELSKEENVVPVRAPVTVVRAREPNQFTRAFHFPSTVLSNPLHSDHPRVIYVNRLETSTGSSRTWWSCSRLAAGHRRPTTSS